MPVATPDDVAAHVRRPLTTNEQAYATTQIAAYTNILESTLKRVVSLNQFVETYHPLAAPTYAAAASSGYSTLHSLLGGRVHLAKLPVQEIISVEEQPRVGAPRDITANIALDGPQTFVVPTLEPVEVTYTAGDNPTHPLVSRFVAGAVARDILTPATAATGAMTNYSVEGTSVSYQGQNYLDQDAVAPFTGAEMRALRAALTRLVIR
jgi:hypothetical protein